MYKGNFTAVVAFLGVICAFIAIIASKRPDRPISDFPYPTSEVVDLAGRGEKVKAVRLYRKQASVGLYDANRVISSLGSWSNDGHAKKDVKDIVE